MKRVFIITGSRDFYDAGLLKDALDAEMSDSIWHFGDQQQNVVVLHGDCPTGADRMADTLLKQWQREGDLIAILPFPADWDKHGKAAGPIRNGLIVDEAINVVSESLDEIVTLAFVCRGWQKSKGTRDMVTQSLNAGIDTRIYFQREVQPS